MVTRLSLAVLCAIPLLVALPNRLDAQGGTIRGRIADAQGAPLARAAVSVDADAALKARKADGTKVQKCKEWLKVFLAKYAFPSGEILAADAARS